MQLPKFRFAPHSETQAPPPVRLVDGDHAFVPSPAREMHEYLWTFADEAPEPPVERYPGWVRLAVVVGGSAVLWGLVIAAVRMAR
jgi:hypothetical protein